MNVGTIINRANGVPATAPTKRMSLDNTIDGVVQTPMRVLIYGAEKVGKTSFAAGAPSPIWLPLDAGSTNLNVRRLPQPETFKEVLEGLHEVETRGVKMGLQTLVIDPLNWIEPLVTADVVGDSGKSLAEWSGGYGRGSSAAMDRWRIVKTHVERVWRSGMNVVICAHSQVKKFEDPEGPAYERYELAMNKDAAGLFKQWVDAILFARREAFGKVDPNTKKAKAYGSAARMLHTEHTPAFDGGNRWCLPPEMPLSWQAFAEARTQGLGRRSELLAQIEAGLKELADAEVERKVRGFLAEPNVNVAELANLVAAKVGERRVESVGKEG
jgi:hypothetical protein